jgi:uncharacterized integral membrane protein
MRMSVKSRIKLIVVAVLVILAVVIVLQNTERVTTKVLFATIILPRAALLFVTLAMGFVAGILFSNVVRGR